MKAKKGNQLHRGKYPDNRRTNHPNTLLRYGEKGGGGGQAERTRHQGRGYEKYHRGNFVGRGGADYLEKKEGKQRGEKKETDEKGVSSCVFTG